MRVEFDFSYQLEHLLPVYVNRYDLHVEMYEKIGPTNSDPHITVVGSQANIIDFLFDAYNGHAIDVTPILESIH